MPTQPHDALFKVGFEAPAAAAALLHELLPTAVRVLVVWKTLRSERGSFVDGKLASQHSDLLFSARLQTGRPGRVYFLLEHQSTNDPTMPLRTLSYGHRIWDRFVKENPRARLAPIIAVLVSHVPGGWKAARAFEDLFDPVVMAISEMAALLPRFSMIVEDLSRLSNDDLAARPLAAFQRLVLWLLRDARDPRRLLGSFEVWIPSMMQLRRTRTGRDQFTMLITYMFRVIDPRNLDELRAKIRELGPHTEEVAMTIAEYLHKKGRKEGLKKGRQQGLEQGLIVALRRQLVVKFQTLGADYEARLQAATPEAIDRYLQRVLTADSLAAVFEDPPSSGSSNQVGRMPNSRRPLRKPKR